VHALGAAPPEFSQREYAVFLLSMAAEIEHSLMVQYLYAAWGLTPILHSLAQERLGLPLAPVSPCRLVVLRDSCA
jgi:hypothetical protein